MKDKYDTATLEIPLAIPCTIPVKLSQSQLDALMTLALATVWENWELRFGQAVCNVYPFEGLHFPELYYTNDDAEADVLVQKFLKEEV